MQDLTAFLLAGGKSLRMGCDKAFLEIQGKTLLEQALQTLRRLTPEVMIVGERKKFARFGPVVEDVFRDRGPLGGIHAALVATATDLNLVMALDLPFIRADFLKYLVAQAQASTALVVVPRVEGRLQPLCAVYRKEFLPSAEGSLARGENKIDLLFEQLNTRILEEREIVREGFAPAIFANVNTLEEFERVKRRRS